MSDIQNDQNPNEEQQPKTEMFVNEYGTTKDGAVVVEEADRTVLLTADETIVIEKQPQILINPKDRPRKVYAGMWGQPEIVSVGVGMLVFLTVVLLYAFLVIPSNLELERNRAERDRLERELTSANEKYGSITSTETHVVTLVNSVSDFESRFLPVSSVGKNNLYQRINGLISAYGLVNTTGPDYTPLELANGGQESDEKGRSKFRSIFPGTYVTMTLEGPYQNLRRFIADIERSQDFVVISSIELEPSDSEGQGNQEERPQTPRSTQQISSGMPIGIPVDQVKTAVPSAVSPQQRGPRGKTHGNVVSLRIELAAYFRRPNFVPVDPQPVSQ